MKVFDKFEARTFRKTADAAAILKYLRVPAYMHVRFTTNSGVFSKNSMLCF
jgi:hypothetical protein